MEVDPKQGEILQERLVQIPKPTDLRAVEEALRIRDQNGGTITVVSVGTQEVEETLRTCLAMGVDNVLRIWDSEWITREAYLSYPIIAYALSSYIQNTTSELILCGDVLTPYEAIQIPAWISKFLSVPLINAVTKLEFSKDFKNTVHLQRKMEKGVRQELEGELPVLCVVDYSINEPRETALPDIINSRNCKIPMLDISFSQKMREMSIERSILQSGQLFPLSPPPEPHRIFRPDSSLPAHDRINQIIAGEKGEKRGEKIQVSPDESAEAMINFLKDKNYIK